MCKIVYGSEMKLEHTNTRLRVGKPNEMERITSACVGVFVAYSLYESATCFYKRCVTTARNMCAE